MSHDIPPGLIAFADQERAKSDGHITRLAEAFKAHTAEHGGDTMCAHATTAISLIPVPHNIVCDLLAAAINRIVRLETVGGH